MLKIEVTLDQSQILDISVISGISRRPRRVQVCSKNSLKPILLILTLKWVEVVELHELPVLQYKRALFCFDQLFEFQTLSCLLFPATRTDFLIHSGLLRQAIMFNEWAIDQF